MGVLQNACREKLGVYRLWGGTVLNSAYPQDTVGNWHLTGMQRNITAGEGISENKVGVPLGNLHPSAWIMPQNAGMISSRNNLNGDATFTGSGALGRNIQSSMTGQGVMSSLTGQLVVSGFASLANYVTVTSNAYAALAAVASIANGVTVSSSLLAKGWASASIDQTTSVVAVRYATGTLEADILPYTELSPQNLATAVWDENLETNYAARELMRVITSALAGKISGAETSTVTIRDINDGKNRITAVVDGNGNRTTITLDVTE